MRYKKIFISILATSCLITAPANANVGAGMQNWFNSMGGFSNTTPPSSYKGQTMNGYSGGGVYVRSPANNYQLAQMTPPSLNIGCGGIDATAGSFSFINQAALTSLFQNVGTSLSYAFLLAIKSSMPTMSSLFEYLQDVANKVNGMNVNSCQMAKGIVSLSGADNSQAGQEAADHTLGAITNAMPDSFSSWSAKRPAKDAARAAAISADPSKKDQLGPSNVVWKALNHSSGLDQQDMQFIMSMTGTIIITPPTDAINPANDGAAAGWVYKEPTIQNVADLIGYATDGSTTNFQMLVCDEPVDCLNPAPGPVTATTFMALIAAKLDNLRNNVISRSFQNINDLNLVQVSSLPVWKMISVTASVNPGLIDSYKRLIAVDVAYAYVDGILRTANQMIANEQNGASAPAGSKDAMAKLQSRLDVMQRNIYDQRKIEFAKVQQQAELERELQLLNQTMVGGLPAQAFNSMIAFGGGH